MRGFRQPYRPQRRTQRPLRAGASAHSPRPPERSVRRSYRAPPRAGAAPRAERVCFRAPSSRPISNRDETLGSGDGTTCGPITDARLRREHGKSSPPARYRVLCPAWPDRRRNPVGMRFLIYAFSGSRKWRPRRPGWCTRLSERPHSCCRGMMKSY